MSQCVALLGDHRHQARLDNLLSGTIIRAAPLGTDRYSRAYWWDLAGHHDGLLLQEGRGVGQGETWGVLYGLEECATLMTALDARGVREKDLKAALEKVSHAR